MVMMRSGNRPILQAACLAVTSIVCCGIDERCGVEIEVEGSIEGTRGKPKRRQGAECSLTPRPSPIYGSQSTQQLPSDAGIGGPVLGIAWVGGFEGNL